MKTKKTQSGQYFLILGEKNCVNNEKIIPWPCEITKIFPSQKVTELFVGSKKVTLTMLNDICEQLYTNENEKLLNLSNSFPK